MISKQQQKYIQSLHNKKYRTEYGEFLVEGEKGLEELLASDFEVVKLYCTEEFAAGHALSDAVIAPASAIAAVSTFNSNAAGIAVVKQKRARAPQNFGRVTLFLDSLRDPGNLGTIVRLADWYGIAEVVCSLDTVEFYNPKVIRSTMGSFTRVNVFYTDLPSFLTGFPYPVYGADLEGVNVHGHGFEERTGLVIGAESHGISREVMGHLRGRVTIPRLGGAESLNAAIATGIILDNMFREV